MTFIVDASGVQSLLQDFGRPGFAAMGVTTSGAFDRAALRRGNRMLGNDVGAAGIEVLLGGLQLRAAAEHLVCLTGAVGLANLDGRPIAHERPAAVKRGQLLSIGAATLGMRTYVTVRGGFCAEPTLGSRSTDTLSQLGPAPLAQGDLLTAGRWEVPDTPSVGWFGEPDSRLSVGAISLRVVLGPHSDWFEATAVEALMHEAWLVSAETNRIGVRIEGPTLRRSRAGELPTTPCLRGAIQVTADGQPIIFGPDHPVTGGYPVIATVIDADTDMLGQARPGQVVYFLRHRV